ncbi:head GIN domain-containing protein [Bizionia paragorgiae]|uniref:Putative auto-transporter adhesin, head GIN domain n=1 Tax=Bizionia paragorgiae TaxID=283786 RepID=A0A1H4CLG9_BIZPA|nr:head GIN domain-containing protein [Bizionia paragorgiae]SEA61194.1 Putative auto-transporter adhesin, head GIN domain [Bizionia paragorgiae]
MKTLFTLVVAVLCISTTQAQWGTKTIKGNGTMATITRSTSNYDGIRCAGSWDFILVKGKEGTITIEGEENLLEYIITEVNGNDLIIKTENNVNLKTSYNKTITITIPFESIDKVALSGSGNVTSTHTIRSKAFETKLSGSGDIVLDVETSDLEATVTGSGDVTLSGRTITFEASVTGSGDIHAYKLNASNADVKVTGSGDLELHCTNSITAKVTGSGSIIYKGNPSAKNNKVTGSGSISRH